MDDYCTRTTVISSGGTRSIVMTLMTFPGSWSAATPWRFDRDGQVPEMGAWRRGRQAGRSSNLGSSNVIWTLTCAWADLFPAHHVISDQAAVRRIQSSLGSICPLEGKMGWWSVHARTRHTAHDYPLALPRQSSCGSAVFAPPRF